MPARPTYASFLVRLWREAEPDPREMAADWQGEVEHIQTSQRHALSTLDELLGLLRQVTDEADATGRVADK
jgi:predicted AlkP superfamily pyrophosphatase or phosphodiesterase